MPVVGKEAKRRRKAAEAEAAEQLKREKMAATVTPDYAASLMSPGLPVSDMLDDIVYCITSLCHLLLANILNIYIYIAGDDKHCDWWTKHLLLPWGGANQAQAAARRNR